VPTLVSADALEGFPDLRGSLLEGRYRVGEVLGVGGMGAVFEAEHVRLGRTVALKVMRPLYMQYRQHVARFLKEARAASQVKHPNVVEILDVGETPDGMVYTVMEFLDGEDLATVLRREGGLPWPQAHDILGQMVAALSAAHDQGVIHRDVKPANCILVPGQGDALEVKMVDFGIAKLQDDELSDDDPLTRTGEVIGTPAYMAPELSLGRMASARTDIYALGVLAYLMTTGERPFWGTTAVEMHIDQTTRAPRSLRAVDPSIPEGAEQLILEMLAVDPQARPRDMDQVAQRLRALAPRARNTLAMTDFSRMREASAARRIAWPRSSAVRGPEGPEGPEGLEASREPAGGVWDDGGDTQLADCTVPSSSTLTTRRAPSPDAWDEESATQLVSTRGARERPAKRTLLASEGGPLAKRTLLASEGGPLASASSSISRLSEQEGGPLAKRTLLASEGGPLASASSSISRLSEQEGGPRRARTGVWAAAVVGVLIAGGLAFTWRHELVAWLGG